MRADSCSMRRRIDGQVDVVVLGRPRRNSSAKPWIDVSGVRSSWEASARNWRSRCSVASRSWKASSISSSIVLSARPSWPTSVRSSAGLTRCDRSPAVMARAESAMCSSGRRPRRRISHDPTASTASRTGRRRRLDQHAGGAATLRTSARGTASTTRVADGPLGVDGQHPPARSDPSTESGGVEVAGERGRGRRAGRAGAAPMADTCTPDSAARTGRAARRRSRAAATSDGPRRRRGPVVARARRSAAAEAGLVASSVPAQSAPTDPQLVVEPVVLRAGVQRVGDDAEHGQAHGHQGDQGEDEPQAQGHRRAGHGGPWPPDPAPWGDPAGAAAVVRGLPSAATTRRQRSRRGAHEQARAAGPGGRRRGAHHRAPGHGPRVQRLRGRAGGERRGALAAVGRAAARPRSCST